MAKKKKERKIPEVGVAHILATFNNTFITIADEEGNIISSASSGLAGFKGTRKATPYAASASAQVAAARAKEKGVKAVSVFVKGPGLGRDAAIKSLKQAKLDILSIMDVTPMPHNGPKPKKRRRV